MVDIEILKIDHLAIWVEDLELLRDFYIKYFGMTCGELYHNPKKNFSSYFLHFAEGGAAIELMNIPALVRIKT